MLQTLNKCNKTLNILLISIWVHSKYIENNELQGKNSNKCMSIP